MKGVAKRQKGEARVERKRRKFLSVFFYFFFVGFSARERVKRTGEVGNLSASLQHTREVERELEDLVFVLIKRKREGESARDSSSVHGLSHWRYSVLVHFIWFPFSPTLVLKVWKTVLKSLHG